MARYVAGACAFLALLAAGCGGDEAEPAAYEVPSLEFSDLEPCGHLPRRGGFRCGELEVPFERQDASYGTTKVGFAARPAGGGDELGGVPIFAAEGGPGYSSTGSAAAYRAFFKPELLSKHDLVLVDQRGTGRSKPVDCPDLQQNLTPEQLGLAACAAQIGKQFESYRTSAFADDIDDVRKALGYERIALYGDSYGTYLAQSYAFRHGETLNALALDSAYPVYGEDAWYPSLIRTAIRSLELACERDPDCPGGAEGARERLNEMTNELRERRRKVGWLVDMLVDSFNFPLEDHSKNDRRIREFLAGDQESYDRYNTPYWPGGRRYKQYSRAGELMVGCNDYPMIWKREATEPERRAQLEQAIREYDPDAFPPFTPREVAYAIGVSYLECLTWPPPTDVYEPPADPDVDEPTNAPVFVVSGEMDSITTVWEGRQVAKLFPDSEQHVIPNGGHVDALYYVNSKAARLIREFIAKNIDG